MHLVHVNAAKDRLLAAGGGYEVVHSSPGLEVAGEPVPLGEGDAVFVEAGAEHRFTAYERLSVLVLFDRTKPT